MKFNIHIRQEEDKQPTTNLQNPEGKLTAGLPATCCLLKFICDVGGYINLQLTSDFSGGIDEILLAGS